MPIVSDWSHLLDIPSDQSLSDTQYLGQTYGLTVGDFDGDGRLDAFLNHHRMGPSTLILQFAFPSAQVFSFDLTSDEHGATFFDIDQDGDLDLLDTSGGKNDRAKEPTDPKTWNRVFLQQDGELSTVDVAGDLGLHYGPSRSRMLVPVNFDGELALFNASLPKFDGTWATAFFRMQSDGSFAEWSPPGIAVAATSGGIGAHLGTDDRIDFVAHSEAEALLKVYEYGAGRYVTTDLGSGTDPYKDLVVADFDGDLSPEILVARNASPNHLFQRAARGDWSEIGAASGLAALAAGTAAMTAGDFDNDGDLDIVALHYGAALGVTYWMNDGAGRFTPEVYADADVRGEGQKIVSGDFDNDGFLDVLIATGTGPPDTLSRAGEYVYLHTEGNGNHWLSLSLRGTQSETSGLGARVYVTTPDGRTRMLEQDSGVHYSMQDSDRLHFGLGSATEAEVTVVWPDGYRQDVGTVSADRRLTIQEDRDADPPSETVRIEAETFALEGFFVETLAGGRQVIRLPNKGSGEATFDFDDLAAPGAGGRHDLRVWFLDENDGTSDATLLVDPDGSGRFEEFATFRFDHNDGLNAGQDANLRSLTFPGLEIGAGTVLKIVATARGGEYARFDHVEIVPADGGGSGGGTSGSATIAIGATADDHETRGGNASNDLELGYNAGYPSPVGLRFTGIDLPSTADITEAHFVFAAKGNSGGVADLAIEIENDLSAMPYSGSSKPNGRDYLDARVDWADIEAWQGGESYRSPDISALIEALIDGGGLAAADAVAFRISGTGTRTAWSFDGSGAPPQLVVAWDDVT